MKLLTVFAVVALVLTAAVPSFSQQADPGWYGRWNLESVQPGVGAPPAPKMGQAVIYESGWVYAGVDSTGALEAEAIAYGPNNGCVLIGLPAQYTCTTKFTDPVHYEFSFLNKGITISTNKCELSADRKTFKESSTTILPGGRQYTQESAWTKVAPASAKRAATPEKK
jgi:hypothetical protein